MTDPQALFREAMRLEAATQEAIADSYLDSDLVNQTEIALRFGITKGSVNKWTKHSSFPEPVRWTRFEWGQVKAWRLTRRDA